jgi:thiamine-phosphate diphosphorylase
VIPRLHLVTDDEVLSGPDFIRSAGAALATGGERVAFHLRGPRTSARRLWEVGSALRPIARAEGAAFFVNDRLDLALALEADGGHLARRSVTLADARAFLGPAAAVGCSVHGRDDAAHASRPGVRPAEFVIVGAVFPTPTHPREEAKGAGVIAEVQGALPGTPVVAIGGIDPGRVPEVMAAGAHGVAVVRAAWMSPDAATAVEALLGALDGRA